MEMKQEDLLKSLEEVRQKHGEEAYNTARKNLALMLILQPRGENFLKQAFPDLDLEPIREEAAKKQMGQPQAPDDMISMMRMHLPNMRSQLHYDIFMACFRAFTLTLDNYFAGNQAAAEKCRSTLNDALDMGKKVRGLEEQVQEIPPENRGPEAEKFTTPPKEFTEAETQQALLTELAGITTNTDLGAWYHRERKRIDTVVTAKYRNPLFDAIRAKQQTFTTN